MHYIFILAGVSGNGQLSLKLNNSLLHCRCQCERSLNVNPILTWGHVKSTHWLEHPQESQNKRRRRGFKVLNIHLKKLDVCILLQVGYNHNTTGALSIANQRSNNLLQRLKVANKT